MQFEQKQTWGELTRWIIANEQASVIMEQRPMMRDFKLRTVAEQLGIVLDESKLHDAMYDIYLTHEVYKRLTF